MLAGTSDEIGASYCLLAESLEYPASRDWVIFTLREDIRFSDGSAITAEDVVFSYDQLRTKGLSSYQTVVAKQVASAEALDARRVKFTFVEGYPRRDLIQSVGSLPIFSKADFDARGIDLEKPLDAPFLGSGPYVLDPHYQLFAAGGPNGVHQAILRPQHSPQILGIGMGRTQTQGWYHSQLFEPRSIRPQKIEVL